MPVQLTIRNFKARSLTVENIELSWSTADTTEDVFDYTFEVLRCESPSGPFDVLTKPFQDRYLFIDNQVPQAHRFRVFFYKIRVTHVPSGDSTETDPVAKEPEADLISMEIRRQLQLLYREFSGRRCWVLPVRTFGQRCECWNEILKKRTRSGCVTCFDTGFVRGYMKPIEVFMDIDPAAKSEQPMNVGTTQQSNTTGRFGYYPPLKPHDLIIEPENRRWRVGRQTQTEHVRARIMQQFQIHEIPSTDIEYRIPLILEEALKDIFLSPARNFTNPHNFENFEKEEIPKIFSLYQSTYPDPYK